MTALSRATAPIADRVLVAVASPRGLSLVRGALRSAGASACAETTTAAGAVDFALRRRPDLCLLDTALPGGAVEATKEINRALPDAVVLLVRTDAGNDCLTFDGLAEGAAGCIDLVDGPSDVTASLRAAMRGEAVLGRAQVTGLLTEFRRRERRLQRERLLVPLTYMERRTLDLLLADRSTAEVAGMLFVSAGTVRSHVAGVVRKLNVEDRRAALDAVRRLGPVATDGDRGGRAAAATVRLAPRHGQPDVDVVADRVRVGADLVGDVH
jgi:DNA-binding NarL/FixJ family response regulator